MAASTAIKTIATAEILEDELKVLQYQIRLLELERYEIAWISRNEDTILRQIDADIAAVKTQIESLVARNCRQDQA